MGGTEQTDPSSRQFDAVLPGAIPANWIGAGRCEELGRFPAHSHPAARGCGSEQGTSCVSDGATLWTPATCHGRIVWCAGRVPPDLGKLRLENRLYAKSVRMVRAC